MGPCLVFLRIETLQLELLLERAEVEKVTDLTETATQKSLDWVCASQRINIFPISLQNANYFMFIVRGEMLGSTDTVKEESGFPVGKMIQIQSGKSH